MEIRHGLDVDSFRAHARNSQIAALAVLTGSGYSQPRGDPIVGHCADLSEDETTPEEPESFALLLKQAQTYFVVIPENFMSNMQSLHCRYQMTVASTFVATPSPPLKRRCEFTVPGPTQLANASARRTRAAESTAKTLILHATAASTSLAHAGMRDRLSNASVASTSLTPSATISTRTGTAAASPAHPPQRQSRMLARGHIRIAKSPDKDDVGAGCLRYSGDRQYGATPDVDVVGLGARAQPGDDVAVRASKRPLQGSGDVWIRFGQDRSNQQIHSGRHIRRPGQHGLLPAGGARRWSSPDPERV